MKSSSLPLLGAVSGTIIIVLMSEEITMATLLLAPLGTVVGGLIGIIVGIFKENYAKKKED